MRAYTILVVISIPSWLVRLMLACGPLRCEFASSQWYALLHPVICLVDEYVFNSTFELFSSLLPAVSILYNTIMYKTRKIIFYMHFLLHMLLKKGSSPTRYVYIYFIKLSQAQKVCQITHTISGGFIITSIIYNTL